MDLIQLLTGSTKDLPALTKSLLLSILNSLIETMKALGVGAPLIDFTQNILLPLLDVSVVLIDATIILMISLINALMMIWVERKLVARLADRRGPSHVGYAGLLQNFADGIKLLAKEYIQPVLVDKLLFNLAPVILVSTMLIVLSVIPLSPTLYVTNPNGSLLLVFALFSLSPFAVFLAGWSSNNKYTVIGGMRAAAQMIAYEIPLIFSVVGVIILSGSLSLSEIAQFQIDKGTWFILYQPLGFALFLIAMLAEIERIPFDLPEAEAELVEGWTTEYGGIRWGFLMLSEYLRGFIGAALLTLLFLGGWSGPLLPGEAWFFIKVYAIFAFMIWIRAALPRVRIDQLLRIGWGKLLPISLLNVLIAVIVVSLSGVLF